MSVIIIIDSIVYKCYSIYGKKNTLWGGLFEEGKKFSMRKYLEKLDLLSEYDLAPTKIDADCLLDKSENYSGVFIEGCHIYLDNLSQSGNVLNIVQNSHKKGLKTIVLSLDFDLEAQLKNDLKTNGADLVLEACVEPKELQAHFKEIFGE
jgi:hypothetical protein